MAEFFSAEVTALLPPVSLFLIGVVVGVINVTAGGGSVLSLPALIFLGLDGGEANGTNRLSIMIQNISATASFSKERAVDLRHSLKLSLLTLPGMVCGVFAAVTIDDELFKKIVAIAIMAVAASMFLPSLKKGGEGRSGRRWLIYPGLVAAGFYGGFIQVGIGLMIMALLFHLVGGSIASVNARKIIIVLVYTVPAVCIFFYYGDVDIFKGLNLAAGSALGGWWGAKLSVKKGASAVRYFLMVAIVLSGLKLLEIL
ncbi:sulfite exporter TauE/SafE family protein [Candidatus Mycalebacterium sp.]